MNALVRFTSPPSPSPLPFPVHRILELPSMTFRSLFHVGPSLCDPCASPSRTFSCKNMYCVLRGEKHFTLLPPSDVLFLYEQEYPQGRFRKKADGSGFEVRLEDGTVPWIPVGEPYPSTRKLPISHDFVTERRVYAVCWRPRLSMSTHVTVGSMGADPSLLFPFCAP